MPLCHGTLIGPPPISAPQRIVSLVPSLTDLLQALDLDDRVAGVTRFCVHPQPWRRTKRVVGGTKTVDVGKVRALSPDLVLANREENVRDQVEAIAAFAPVYLTDVATLEDALAMIADVGALTGTEAAAGALATWIAEGFASLAAAPPLRAAYFIWKDPWMTVGGDTFIHDVLTRTGFVNVFGDRTRYPEVTPEDVAAARPDVLMFSSEPFRFREKHVGAVRAACPDAAVWFVDGEAFSWYGPRLLHTPEHVRALRRMPMHDA
jgi:ABC-type Fe3+-hydroxamate transport system substrate-binding protein